MWFFSENEITKCRTSLFIMRLIDLKIFYKFQLEKSLKY